MSRVSPRGDRQAEPETGDGRGTFGELLLRLRRAAGMSQETLAEHARLSVEAISALERGRRRAPYRETVRMIVEALALDAEHGAALEAAARANLARRLTAHTVERRADADGHDAGRRTNLRPALSSFVGRDGETAKIAALLAAHRLVTVTGSGGVGKTRTCIQVAATLRDVFGDGVWLIELAPLAGGEYVASTLALTLGVRAASGFAVLDGVVRALEPTCTLLVFDNCEHLADAAAQTIDAILGRCPRVKILASSRQPLAIDGEAKFRLPSLDVPAAGVSPVTEREAARFGAIALFVERARALDADFVLTDRDAPVVAEICRRLDGIPLAIELAAARAHVVSVRQLLRLLDAHLDGFTGYSRNTLPRHETLRALIGWSYDLLDDLERVLFRRLGVFANTFALDGAAAVGGAGFEGRFHVLDVLTALVDKSLVLAEPHGEEMRFRLLESTRVYAREKLHSANEDGFASGHLLRYMHERFRAARVESDRTGRRGPLDDLLALELEDVRAALNTALLGAETALGGELLADIGSRWGSIGLDDEGVARVELFRALLSDADADRELLARLAISAAWLAQNLLAIEAAFDVAAQAVAYARAASSSSQTLADALFAFALSAAGRRQFADARAALDEAEAIAPVPRATRLRLLAGRAFLHRQQKDLDSAALAYEQLRAEHHALNNAAWERAAAMTLAEVEYERGRTSRAIALVTALLPDLRAHRDRVTLVKVLTNVAGYLTTSGDVAGARAAAREAIEAHLPHDPDAPFVAIALEHLGLLIARSGDALRACTLAGYVDAAYRRHRYDREYTERTSSDCSRELLETLLGPDERRLFFAQGALLSSAAAIRLALDA